MVHAHDGAAVAEVAHRAVVAAAARLCVPVSGSETVPRVRAWCTPGTAPPSTAVAPGSLDSAQLAYAFHVAQTAPGFTISGARHRDLIIMAALVLSVAGAAAGRRCSVRPAPLPAAWSARSPATSSTTRCSAATRPRVEGPRLADLDVMASTEGAPIPRVYGRARLAGQVIWATNLEEVVSTRRRQGGGKGRAAAAARPRRRPIAISPISRSACAKGRSARSMRVWADGKPLDLTGLTMRIYTGDETQTPDPLIVAKEGDAPAYRGLAYVVFERLPLENFGNRIPQLSFEVVRPVGQLETMVRAVTLIPGTTEFGYEPAPWCRSLGPGQSAPENRHVTYAAVRRDRLARRIAGAVPESRARRASWSPGSAPICAPGSAASCRASTTRPRRPIGATWSVAGVDARRRASGVARSTAGRPTAARRRTTACAHLIAELKARGLKVTLYPFVMMDIPAGNALPDPWTGARRSRPIPGAAASPAIRRRGRPARPTARRRRRLRSTPSSAAATDGWNYRRHGPALRRRWRPRPAASMPSSSARSCER